MDARNLHQSHKVRPSTDGIFRPAALPKEELAPAEPQELLTAPEPTELIEAPEPVQRIAAPRKSAAKALWVTLLVLVLIGAATFGGWYYWRHNHKATPAQQATAASNTSVQPPAPFAPFVLAAEATDPILKEVQDKINTSYANLGVDTAATKNAQLIRYHYQSDSYDVIATAPDALGIRKRDNPTGIGVADTTSMLTIIQTILTAHKYTNVTVPTIVQGNTYMTNGSRICELNFSANRSPDSISCTNFTDVDKQANNDRLFYQSLKTSNATAGVVSLFTNSIGPSKTTGYQLATVGIGKNGSASAGLFYMKTGGPWKFFISTESEVACAKYQADPDTRAAYQGISCLDANNKDTTVN
jgi:hypothetical protein